MADQTPSAGRPSNVEIEDFLSSLDTWGLLNLRSRLRSDRHPLVGLANLGDLPLELISRIAQTLTVPDILNCCLVARACYHKFSHDAVMRPLCRRIYPGLVEVAKSNGNKGTPGQLLISEARRLMRRHRTHTPEEGFIAWDDEPNHVPITQLENLSLDQFKKRVEKGQGFPPEFVYHGHKVAWKSAPSLVTIDDLHTGERQRCHFMSAVLQGNLRALVGMSDEVLVFKNQVAENEISAFHIWNLELQQWRRCSLPASTRRIFAFKSSVAFVTALRECFLLKWGQPLGQLEANEHDLGFPMRQLRAAPGVIFSPTDAETIFTVWISGSGFGDEMRVGGILDLRISVLEYKAGRFVKRHITSFIPDLTKYDNWGEGPDTFSHSPCTAMDSNGGFAVLSVDPELEALRTGWGPRKAPWTVVAFNAITLAFRTLYYRRDYDSSLGPFKPLPHSRFNTSLADAIDDARLESHLGRTIWQRDIGSIGSNGDSDDNFEMFLLAGQEPMPGSENLGWEQRRLYPKHLLDKSSWGDVDDYSLGDEVARHILEEGRLEEVFPGIELPLWSPVQDIDVLRRDYGISWHIHHVHMTDDYVVVATERGLLFWSFAEDDALIKFANSYTESGRSEDDEAPVEQDEQETDS